MYRFICPPPSAKKTSSEAKNAKKAKRKGTTQPSTDSDEEDQKGVMYYEYDFMFHLMFHYLLASLHSVDGEYCVTSTGAKIFNIFAGLEEHRYVLLFLNYTISLLIFLLRFALRASAPIY